MPRTPLPVIVALILGVVALTAYPAFADTYSVRLMSKVMVLAIFAMSLDLLVGYAGLVSLGHAAFFGVGAYVTAALIAKAGISEIMVILPASLAASALAALVIGWFSIRTSGIYFLMITLAFAQMLYFFFHDMPFWWGGDGVNLSRAQLPKLSLGDTMLLDLSDRMVLYYTVLGSLVACYVLLMVLLRAPFGRVLLGIRVNENRVRALGYDVQRYKLVAFVIAGTLAGFAGFLEAARTGFVAPAHLSWHESGFVLIIVLLGGMGTLFGPILGAFVLVLLEDWMAGLTDRWLLVMGMFVISMVLFLPNGIAGLLAKVGQLRRTPRKPTPGASGSVTEAAADG